MLAPTLAGHPGGPPIDGDAGPDALTDSVERALDDAGWERAHLAGNSLGGHLALRLAARGRAVAVVAFAPAGGWAPDDDSRLALFDRQRAIVAAAKAVAPHVEAVLATPEGRRRVTQDVMVDYEHVPKDLLADQLLALARFDAADRLVDAARRSDWSIEAERIACPVRIVWGTADRLLPWPSAAARYREEWLPHADWVVLDGVGHAPQLDVPLEAAQLILGFAG